MASMARVLSLSQSEPRAGIARQPQAPGRLRAFTPQHRAPVGVAWQRRSSPLRSRGNCSAHSLIAGSPIADHLRPPQPPS